MDKSKHFDKVVGFYKDGSWDIGRVRDAIGKWITEDEYEIIVGEKFELV